MYTRSPQWNVTPRLSAILEFEKLFLKSVILIVMRVLKWAITDYGALSKVLHLPTGERPEDQTFSPIVSKVLFHTPIKFLVPRAFSGTYLFTLNSVWSFSVSRILVFFPRVQV